MTSVSSRRRRLAGLLRANLLQLAQLIAQPRRILELQRGGRLLHALLQIGDHLGVAPFEHADGPAEIARVVARG